MAAALLLQPVSLWPLADVFGAVTLVSAVLRCRTLEPDALYLVGYLGLMVLWPYPGDAHRFINRTERDVKLLVIGDRSAGDEISYPDVDMHAVLGTDGVYKFTTKKGEPL